MAAFRFVQAGGLLLDTPLGGISRGNPFLAKELRDASLRAWENLVDLTLRVGARLLIVTGNLYEGPARGLRGYHFLMKGFEKLASAHVTTALVLGPKDCPHLNEALSPLSPWVLLFSSSEAQRYCLEEGSALLAVLYGRSFDPDLPSQRLLEGFTRRGEEGIHIGVVPPLSPEPSAEENLPLKMLLEAGLDYWALGEGTSFRILSEKPSWVLSSGVVQARSSCRDGAGAKGAVVADVDGSSVRRIHFEPVDRVRFVSLEVNLSCCNDRASLHEKLHQRLTEVKAENPQVCLVVKALLKGAGPLRPSLLNPENQEELLAHLREEAWGEDPPLWWESVEVDPQTFPAPHRFPVREDLCAAVLRQRERFREDPEALARFCHRIWRPLSHLGGHDAFPPPGASDREALLEQAVSLALHTLTQRESP